MILWSAEGGEEESGLWHSAFFQLPASLCKQQANNITADHFTTTGYS